MSHLVLKRGIVAVWIVTNQKFLFQKEIEAELAKRMLYFEILLGGLRSLKKNKSYEKKWNEMQVLFFLKGHGVVNFSCR